MSTISVGVKNNLLRIAEEFFAEATPIQGLSFSDIKTSQIHYLADLFSVIMKIFAEARQAAFCDYSFSAAEEDISQIYEAVKCLGIIHQYVGVSPQSHGDQKMPSKDPNIAITELLFRRDLLLEALEEEKEKYQNFDIQVLAGPFGEEMHSKFLPQDFFKWSDFTRVINNSSQTAKKALYEIEPPLDRELQFALKIGFESSGLKAKKAEDEKMAKKLGYDVAENEFIEEESLPFLRTPLGLQTMAEVLKDLSDMILDDLFGEEIEEFNQIEIGKKREKFSNWFSGFIDQKEGQDALPDVDPNEVDLFFEALSK